MRQAPGQWYEQCTAMSKVEQDHEEKGPPDPSDGTVDVTNNGGGGSGEGPEGAGSGEGAGGAGSGAGAKEEELEDAKFRKELRKQIRPTLEIAYVNDMSYTAKSRLWLRKAGDILEVCSKLFSALATVLAFTSATISGTDKEAEKASKWLAVGSGISGTLSLVVLLLANYLQRQAKERNMQLNVMLEAIGIKGMPDNSFNLDEDSGGSGQNTATAPGLTQPGSQPVPHPQPQPSKSISTPVPSRTTSKSRPAIPLAM